MTEILRPRTTAVLQPSEIVRPKDDAVVRLMVTQMDTWWQGLSFEQKMSAYSVTDQWHD